MADVSLRTVRSNGPAQLPIQFKDEGANLGASGTVLSINFVGAGVIASRVGDEITVTVSTGGGGGGVEDHGDLTGLSDDDHLQYHTDARALAWLGTRTTADLPEGSNLWFTNERVDDRVATLIQNGTGLTWVYNDGANTLTGTVSLSSFSTTNLAEGTNLYFTNVRADARTEAFLPTFIANGTGISWTYDGGAHTFTGNVSLSSFNTDALTEGSTNLYYTDARVDARIGAAIPGMSFNAGILFQDEGVALGAAATVDTINFVGSGVSVARVDNVVTVTIDGTGDGDQSGIQFVDHGDDLGAAGTVDELEFTGPGVSASRVGNKVTVNVSTSSANSISGTYIASENMNGHRVVRSTGASSVGYADSGNAAHGDDTVGITTDAVDSGDPVEVFHAGYLTFVGWSWTPGQPVYFGASGQLTQTPPVSGFVQVVGHAAASDTMFVSIESPIYY